MAKKNSLDDMRDEAYRRQDNLASDIDELIDRVNPKNAAQRWKNEIVGSVKSFSDAGDGKTPATLPVAIAGGVIGVIVLGAGIAAVVALSGDGEKKSGEKKSGEKKSGGKKSAGKRSAKPPRSEQRAQKA